MPKMTDPFNGIALSVPQDLVVRYRDKGYKLVGGKAGEDGGKTTAAKELDEYSAKELAAYGAELGLTFKGNASKVAMIEAIKAHLAAPASDGAESGEADGAADESDDAEDDKETSRDW